MEWNESGRGCRRRCRRRRPGNVLARPGLLLLLLNPILLLLHFLYFRTLPLFTMLFTLKTKVNIDLSHSGRAVCVQEPGIPSL